MEKKGISLIVLVITIVVVIILAAAVILALGRNNPITDSRVAGLAQTRDSLSSGILIYATGVQSKTLGTIGVKDILIEGAEYSIVVADRSTDKTVTKDGVSLTLYKLDDTKVKEKLNVDLKNDKDLWYIDENGLVYRVYDDLASIPTYLKENNSVLTSVQNFVTYNGGNLPVGTSSEQTGGGSSTPAVTTYTVTYDANGGSGSMDASTGEIVTIAANTFTAPEGKRFKNWNTEIDGSGTTYNAGATISSSLTLHAQWEDIIYEAFSVGDQVTISNNGTNETFFVIKASNASEDTVTVITKEYINTTTLTQTSGNYVAFSGDVYWWNQNGVKSAYSDVNGGLNNDPPSGSESYALTAVKAYGTRVGGTGRLLLNSEAETLQSSNSALLYANDGIYKASGNYLYYWMGTAETRSIGYGSVYTVTGSSISTYSYSQDGFIGVRPVVTISKALVTKVTN